MTTAAKVMDEELRRVIENFAGRKILVVGDLLADQFLYGAITRVSREAPVLILRHERTEVAPGGAANCAANLASLGAEVIALGIVGTDAAGNELLDKLRALQVDVSHVVRDSAHQTTTKTRVLAGQLHSTRQQVIRIDNETSLESDSALLTTLVATLKTILLQVEAVIVSDYNYGVAASLVIEALRHAMQNKPLPVIADSRFRLQEFAGLSAATPNQDEVEELLGQRFENVAELAVAGEELRRRLEFQALLITRGSNGMLLLTHNEPPLELAPIGAREAVDVTGAGDTVIAAFTLTLAAGGDYSMAARVANHAGGLVVMKRGTATVLREELQASIIEHLS